MWKSIILITLAFNAGCVYMLEELECDTNECEDMGNIFQRSYIDGFYLKELFALQLNRACPQVLKRIDCTIEKVGICLDTENLESLSNSKNESVAATVNLLLGIADLATQICDKKSIIHKAYKENAACMHNYFTVDPTDQYCYNQAQRTFRDYNVRDKLHYSDVPCMAMAHSLACMASDLEGACGEDSKELMIQIVERSMKLRYFYCTLRDHSTTLKNVSAFKAGYFNFLQLTGSRRIIFEKIFNLI